MFEGTAGKAIEAGETRIGGRIAVNPSGDYWPRDTPLARLVWRNCRSYTPSCVRKPAPGRSRCGEAMDYSTTSAVTASVFRLSRSWRVSERNPMIVPGDEQPLAS